MSTIKKDIPSIWALKGLCAIFVVLIHIPFNEDKYILPILNISVPTFFMISGYFLYSENISNSMKKIKTWVKKIAFLSISLNLFYYVCLAGVGNVKNIEDVLITLFTGDRICGHLWYLSALLWALIIFYILLKSKTDKYVRYLPVLMLFSILLGRYSFLYAEEPGIQALRANFLFPALPCLSVGYLIRKHEQKLMQHRYIIPPLFFILLTLIYLECYTLVFLNLNNNTSYLFMTLPMAAIVMIMAVRHKSFQVPILTGIGKKHSDKLYFFHIAVCAILTRFVYSSFPELKYFSAIIVIIVTLAVSCIINLLAKKLRHYSPIKHY